MWGLWGFWVSCFCVFLCVFSTKKTQKNTKNTKNQTEITKITQKSPNVFNRGVRFARARGCRRRSARTVAFSRRSGRASGVGRRITRSAAHSAGGEAPWGRFARRPRSRADLAHAPTFPASRSLHSSLRSLCSLLSSSAASLSLAPPPNPPFAAKRWVGRYV
jgi:hypothetical protein